MLGDSTPRVLRRHRYLALGALLVGLIVPPPAARAADEVLLDRPPEVAPAPAPLYMRTALEELGFLGIQTAWYWSHGHGSGSEAPEGLRTRFLSTSDMVLDDDRFKTGAVGHPIAGTGYYLIARGNGFGVLGSAVATILASATWQYFSEWNEKPATNDLLVTPAAGWVIGEASYQVGQYFLNRGPGVVDCLGAALFSPVATLNDARPCRLGDSQNENRGDGRRWHRFDLDVGTAHSVFNTGQTANQLQLGAEAVLTTNPHYQRAGAGRSVARPGQWTSLATAWLVDDGAQRGAYFHADSIAVGDYWRRYDDASAVGPLDGRGTLLAVGSSFDYTSRAVPVRWDRVMSVGLIGPMFEFAAAREPFELRAKAAAYYGFAQVTSLAYPQMADSLSNQFIRTVLREQGYYYAQALLPAAEAEARYGQFRLKLAGRGGEYWSINADDTHQGEITDPFALRDARLFTAASLAVQPYCGPLRFALEFASAFWKGSLLGQRVTASEQTISASIFVGL